MKARVKLSRDVRREITRQWEKMSEGNTRRIYKLMCAALNEEGFGAGRISRVMARINALTDEAREDEIFWTHIDKLMHQIGMDFDPETDDEFE